MKTITKKSTYLISIIACITLIGIDQLTKYYAVLYLKDTSGIDIINHVFRLQYLENKGAAFGMLEGFQGPFIVITLIVMFGLAYVYTKIPASLKYLPMRICAIFLMAGAIGNLIDRILYGYVVDFLYFSLIDFPIFNVADMYVTVTTFVFMILMIFFYTEEDLLKVEIRFRKNK